MEEVIRFRLLVNELQDKEFNIFLNKLSHDEIISIMLKGFIYIHEENLNSNVSNINNIIYNIIKLRQSNQPAITDNKLNIVNINKQKTVQKIKLNELPSTIIRECASYLDVDDYLDFAQCDGSLYVACNSPCSLQSLDMTQYGYPADLSRFPLLKTICVDPEEFYTEYEDLSQYGSERFKGESLRVKTMTLNMDGSNDAYSVLRFSCEFCDKYIFDKTKIEALKCKSFGSPGNLYESKAFCKYLECLPNVNNLYISGGYFTAFTYKNDKIAQLLPKLKWLTIAGGNMEVNIFRDKLIETHKNIEFLGYSETRRTIGNLTKSNKLKQLIINNPNLYSLSNVINISYMHNLEKIWLHVYRVDVDNKTLKDIMSRLFSKNYNMRVFKVSCKVKQFEKIIKLMEVALMHSEDVEREFINIFYHISYDNISIDIEEIILYLRRIINILSMSSTKHFTVTCFISENIKTINIVKKKKLVGQLEKRYLVLDIYEKKSHQYIQISNKDCEVQNQDEIWWNNVFL
eukprot:458175_1